MKKYQHYIDAREERETWLFLKLVAKSAFPQPV